MARKTVADLEKENAELKAQLEAQPVGEPSQELVALQEENDTLKGQVQLSAEEQAKAEARLVNAINDMEEMTVINGQVQVAGIKVFYGSEYTEDLERRGITKQGKLTIEVLRVSINSDWAPSMVMREFGLTEQALQQVVWRLSERELRDRPIKLDFKRDLFSKEG